MKLSQSLLAVLLFIIGCFGQSITDEEVAKCASANKTVICAKMVAVHNHCKPLAEENTNLKTIIAVVCGLWICGILLATALYFFWQSKGASNTTVVLIGPESSRPVSITVTEDREPLSSEV